MRRLTLGAPFHTICRVRGYCSVLFSAFVVVLCGWSSSSVAHADVQLINDQFNDYNRHDTAADRLDANWLSFNPQVVKDGATPTVATHNDGAIEGGALRFEGTSEFAYAVATFASAVLSPGTFIEIGFDFALGSAGGQNADGFGPKLGLFHNNRTPLAKDNPAVVASPTQDDNGYLLVFRRNLDGKLVLRRQNRTDQSFSGGNIVATWDPAVAADTRAHHLTLRFTSAAGAPGLFVRATLDNFVAEPVTLTGPDAVFAFNEIVVSTFTGGTTGYIDNIYVTTNVLSRTFYYTNEGAANAYGYGSFQWDGANLAATASEVGQLPGFTIGGSNKVDLNGLIYSGRGNHMYEINPTLGTSRGVSAGVNNGGITSINPAGTAVFRGWVNSALASFATGTAFGPGAKHTISGDDHFATALAWDANRRVWYTTGSSSALGNVGTIDLRTFMTTRALRGLSATSIVFDPYTGDLFTAGIDGIAQIDPSTGKLVSTWKNPQGTGPFIHNLDVTGTGQLVAYDSGAGLLRLWDFTAGTGLIGDPATVQGSAPVTLKTAGITLAEVAGPPFIFSPLNMNATVNQPFVYQCEATNTASWSVTKLPPGLTFDSTLNAIVGTPSSAGRFPVALAAKNAFGTSNATVAVDVGTVPAAGPLIISSTSATGRTNQPFDFQVITTRGTPQTRLTATGLPPGLSFDAASGVISGTPLRDGSFLVFLAVQDGNLSSTGTLQLTFLSDGKVPIITSPSEATITPGVQFTYQMVAPATTAPGAKTSFALIGNLPAGLGFDSTTGTIFGTPAVARASASGPTPNLSGGVITNVQMFATTPGGTSTLPLVFYLAPSGLVNISTRLSVGTGDDALIAGFILTGNAPKKLIVRAIGPSLTHGGSPLVGRLMDPTLDLNDSTGALIGSNDDWRSSQEAEILDIGIQPTDDRESAAVAILNVPGGYTATVRGKGNTTGTGLVEVYDLGTASLDTSSNSHLANLSTRGLVKTGDDVLIGGFIVSATPTKVILRAIGPSLSARGITNSLDDPTLDLVDANGAIVRSDDDWQTGGQKQEIIDTHIQPTDDRESALISTLAPGGYTAIVRGKNNGIGVGLIEAYVLD